MANPYAGTTGEQSWDDGYSAGWYYPDQPTPPAALAPDQADIWVEGHQAGREAAAAQPADGGYTGSSGDAAYSGYSEGPTGGASHAGDPAEPAEHGEHGHDEGAETAVHYAYDAAAEGAGHLPHAAMGEGAGVVAEVLATGLGIAVFILTCGSMIPGHEPLKVIEDDPDPVEGPPEFETFVAACGYRHEGPYEGVATDSLIWISASTDQSTAYSAGQEHKQLWQHLDNVELFGITAEGEVGLIYAIS